jgi:hypothetical protein
MIFKVLFISLFNLASAIKSNSLDPVGESSAELLLNHVFENYDKRIRPFAAENIAVHIEMTIVLGILIEIVS